MNLFSIIKIDIIQEYYTGITGMILSNKEKTLKLCNLKSDRHMHVADMRCAGRGLIRGVWGACSPKQNFYYQHGFLDF